MDSQDLRKLLDQTADKFSIFADRNTLVQYKMNSDDLIDLINSYLNDEQKAQLFELEHFKKLPSYINYLIFGTISNSEIKLELLKNSSIVSDFQDYQIRQIVKSLDNNGKIQILHDTDFLKKYSMEYEIEGLIQSLDDKNKQELLSEKEFIQNQLHLTDYEIREIIKGFSTDEVKTEMIAIYKLPVVQVTKILQTYSDENKIDIILQKQFGKQYKLDKMETIELISSLNISSLKEFLLKNKEFLQKNNIKPYKIVKSLNNDKQLEFVSELENMGLTLTEKRQILATLDPKTKDKIDTSKLPKEYVTALEMQVGDDFKKLATLGLIQIDLNKDLEIYRGLDEMLSLNPMEVPEEQKKKILELCKICPQIKIQDNLGVGSSTAQEYINGEAWVDSVLQEIDANWSTIQKIAFIDHAIGKKISYSPDFDTEVFNMTQSRALWKIINSGYGVCNGISQVEKYILDKIGVESELVSGKNHGFIKLKNVELPNADGTKSIGDTILDPTWNLMAQRYGARPGNFCLSYEDIRKHDIDANRNDRECHKNDEALSSATLSLDDQSLRKIYKSIGIADKDGNFPVKALVDRCKSIDDYKLPNQESIKRLFEALKEYYPDFAKCQNSTMSILQMVVLNQENLEFTRCVVNRVYAKDDENMRPILYVYADLPDAGKKFYFADSQKGEFIETAPNEFEARFECYTEDMKKLNGHRPWEIGNTPEKTEDLVQNPSKVVAQKEPRNDEGR